MTRSELKAYCLSKPGTSADFPFDETIEAFRVMGKLFALSSVSQTPPAVNLKCDPEWALVLRNHYAAVAPGYHMNKTHWNTVTLDGEIPHDELVEMIDHSYRLVVTKLTRGKRAQLNALANQT